MDKLLLGNINNGGEIETRLYIGADRYRAYFADTFEPGTAAGVLPLEIGGGTWKDRRESCRNLAINYQYFDHGGISYGELAIIQYFFEINGRRYGLLREFRENGII